MKNKKRNKKRVEKFNILLFGLDADTRLDPMDSLLGRFPTVLGAKTYTENQHVIDEGYYEFQIYDVDNHCWYIGEPSNLIEWLPA